jgi:hypothetical protein
LINLPALYVLLFRVKPTSTVQNRQQETPLMLTKVQSVTSQ